jgi:hypothetical protein
LTRESAIRSPTGEIYVPILIRYTRPVMRSTLSKSRLERRDALVERRMTQE